MEIAASRPNTAHVVVLGNEKGGTGKSTTAMNLIVALLKLGHRVASIDIDSRQGSLSRFVENRTRWARETGRTLEIPTHHAVKLATGNVVREMQEREFAEYAAIIDSIENDFDFIVVDTPASDSYLMRLSHAMADTLITPVNDSYVDVDVLGHFHAATSKNEVSHYGAMVDGTRGQRRIIDGKETDWVVVRNRMSTLSSRNERSVAATLTELSAKLGFRLADGISERVIFREFFPLGLTACDTFDRELLGSEPTMSHLAARQEVRDLVRFLGFGERRSAPPAAPATAGPALQAAPAAGESAYS